MNRGFCGIGVVHGKSPQNVGTLWRSAEAFGAAFIFTIDQRYSHQLTDKWATPDRIPLLYFPTVTDLRAHLPFGCQLIGVEIAEGARPLPKFTHPARACYLLGAEDCGLTNEARTACHQLVVLPAASHCLNVAVAGSIVLYDRATRGAPL